MSGKLVEATHIVLLMERLGPTAAATLLGATPGTLHKCRNSGTAPAVIEKRARKVWRAIHDQ